MFDNMTRHFSRRGSDKEEINTTSATLGLSNFDDEANNREYVEKDIDSFDVNAPAALNDFISTLDDSEGLIHNEEVISANEVGDDDDFQDI